MTKTHEKMLNVTREMQIKTTKMQITPVRMASIRKSTNSKCWRRREGKETSCIAGGSVNWCSNYREQYGASSRTLKIVTIWSCNPTPSHVSRQNSNSKRCIHPYHIAALFAIVKHGSKWNVHGQMDKDHVVYTHTHTHTHTYTHAAEYSGHFSCSVVSESLRPMDCSTPGLPVHHQLPVLAQTHVHWVGDAIQSSHPLVPFSSCLQSFPASGSFPTSQFFASGGQSIGVSASASVLPMTQP